MQNILSPINYQGREGLSRSLKSHLSHQGLYYISWVATAFLGGFLLLDVFSQLLTGNFKYFFRITSLLEILGFAVFLIATLILRETKNIRVHLHGDHFYFEGPGEKGLPVQFANVLAIRFARHKRFVPGFYLDLKEGKSIHIPLFLERVDYILDALRFYRPELCTDPQFLKIRSQGVLADHWVTRHHGNFSRSKIEGLWLILVSPLVVRHDQERLQKDPTQVRRDLSFENSIKIKYRRIALISCLSLVAICFYDIFN